MKINFDHLFIGIILFCIFVIFFITWCLTKNDKDDKDKYKNEF